MISWKILKIVVFSLVVLAAVSSSGRRCYAAATTETSEASQDDTEAAFTSSGYDVLDIATWGDASGTPTRDVTHTLDDIYVVLLLILVVLVVWFMFSNILKIVKIFTSTRWK
jgi:hypothetical protein